ncbi:MAG: lamin tail domain-containing protein [Anaerolineae bacterium]
MILIFDVALPSASAHDTYPTSEMNGSLVCDTTALARSVASAQGSATPAAIAPGDILINEVAFQEVNDWIEFYNDSSSSVDIQYWVVEERTTGIKTFSSYFMAPGEYVVLNLNSDLPDEITSDVNGNGHRDFYSRDKGLTGTDNVVILRDGVGNIIDAMALANAELDALIAQLEMQKP